MSKTSSVALFENPGSNHIHILPVSLKIVSDSREHEETQQQVHSH